MPWATSSRSSATGQSEADDDGWDEFSHHLAAAAVGDDTSALIIQGGVAHAAGDLRLAVDLYERAARGGEPQGMYEISLIHRKSGDLQSARSCFEAAAGSGFTDAYGHLANLAEEAGDPRGEREWSRRGAEAGHGWSMANYAYFLLTDVHQGVQSGAAESAVLPVLRQCLDYATKAANMGHVNAMYSAGHANAFLDRRRDALDWLTRAERNGHPDARRMIQQFNLT
jgi:TPR repeat protein